jgi:RNA-splicing ligase RtcB
MIELKGKYTSAKIFADTIEEGVYQQIYDAINCPAFANQSVAIMPDCHCGAGCVVGLVATIGDWVNPSHIGVDIGCTVSMLVLDREIPEEKYADFEHKVKNVLPFGMNLQPKTIIDEKDFYKFLTK